MAAEAYLNESKYVHKKCEHGKQKYFCKECGGKGYCEHGKLRHNCPECSTTNCEHGKQKNKCMNANKSGEATLNFATTSFLIGLKFLK